MQFLRSGLLGTMIALAAILVVATGCRTGPEVSDAPLTRPPETAPVAAVMGTRATDTPSDAPNPTASNRSTPGETRVDAPTRGAAVSSVMSPGTDPMIAAHFPTPPDRDLALLAQQLKLDGVRPPQSSEDAGADLRVGDERDFWTLDYPKRKMISHRFRLAAISDSAYWWLRDDSRVDDDDLRNGVDQAESQVFPRIHAVFGQDTDARDPAKRFHIVSGRIPGVGGYVAGGDLYPAEVSPYSNEVEAIYVNSRAAEPGDEAFLHILAHELQHALHQRVDESEATWLNEGLAELAVSEAGYRVGSIFQYLRRPDASLVNWPDDLGGDVGLNYGAAALFAHYVREHYAPDGGLQDLLDIEQDGIKAVDAFLAARGITTVDGVPVDFHTIFSDWIAANLLDAGSGVHGYQGLDVEASITRRLEADDGPEIARLAQYAADYVEIRDAEANSVIHFEGAGVTPLFAVDVPGECWWSNRGDSISATLTRRVAVPVSAPDNPNSLLTYHYWHDIEEDWDYLYVSASTDRGNTWDVLQATGTTDSNPMGNSYGFAYTGASDGWRDGSASLAEYAGEEILLRFHYVTDDAINGPGFCVRDMQVTGEDGDAHNREWTADGFVLVNNNVRQDWIVWVIADGNEPAATRMELHWDASGERHVGSAPVPDVSDGNVVVALAPTAPATMEGGEYQVWVESVK